MFNIMKNSQLLICAALLFSAVGCASKAANLLNPYDESPDVELGERNSKAIMDDGSDGGGPADNARHSLEVMKSYRAALLPEPNYPGMYPAVIRLMWIPDHLNGHGDLVPAHYYYLNVLPDRPAVTDAFELERQLDVGSAAGGSATPWVIRGK